MPHEFKRGTLDRSAVNVAIRPAFSSSENRFVTRFAESIAAAGYNVLELRWLSVTKYDFVILHWPDDFFRGGSAKETISALVKLVLLKLGRTLRGTRLIWVAHNARPHDGGENPSSLTVAFFRNLDGIIFLSRQSRDLINRLYPATVAIPSVSTVHGHYRNDFVTAPRSQPVLDGGVRLAYFGQIRPYKNVVELVARARDMSARDVTLAVVGRCQDRDLAQQIVAAAGQASGVRLDVRTTLIPDAELEASIDSCHGVVLPYHDILNSGAALLALSRDRPLLAPRIGALPELQTAVGTDWVQLYEGSLTGQVLDDFATFLRTRGPASSPDLSSYDWEKIASSLAGFIDQLVSGKAPIKKFAGEQNFISREMSSREGGAVGVDLAMPRDRGEDRQHRLESVETSIVILSYRRPQALERAVISVLAQRDVDAPLEIIVVDNDPQRSAEPVAKALARDGTVPIRYVAESNRGISHARNAGVAAAAGRYLAFLDDDEEAEPGWLASFLSCLRRFGADAAVGPVYPRFPAPAAVDPYCRRVYTRDAGAPTGTAIPSWNIGNSIFVKERCFEEAVPFDPRLGLTGGEDTVFLSQLTRSNRRLVWCAEAVAWETIPVDRIDPDYLVRRMFRGGQTTTFVCTAVRPRELARAARLMVVGCAQLVLWGPPALILRLCNDARWLPVMAKAAGGLGKLLWHPRLHLRLYR